MPIPAILGAGLIAGAGNILGGALNFFGQKGANQANIRLQRDAQQFETQMWEKNNLYNSPQEQMQRLADAGLNPNLIYGSSAPTGLSSSYPKPHVATVTNELQGLGTGVSSALGQFFDIKLKQAQIDAVNNNADLTLQKTINESIRGNLMGKQALLADVNAQRIKSLLPYQTQAIEGNIEKLRLANKDMIFKLQSLNPAQLNSLLLRNAESTQRINELNPALLNLRQLQSSMMKLNLDFETGLKKYNVTSSDSFLLRTLAKMLGGGVEAPTFKSLKPSTSDEMRAGRYW